MVPPLVAFKALKAAQKAKKMLDKGKGIKEKFNKVSNDISGKISKNISGKISKNKLVNTSNDTFGNNNGIVGNIMNRINNRFESNVNNADDIAKEYIGPIADRGINITKDLVSGIGNVTSGVAGSIDTKFNIVFRAIVAVLLIALIIVIVLIIVGVLKPSDFSMNSNNSTLSQNSNSNYSTSSNKGYFNFLSEMTSGYSLRIFGDEKVENIKDNNKSERNILNGRCNDIDNITSKDNLNCIKNIKIDNLKWEIDKKNELLDYNKLPDKLKNKDKESISIPFKLHDTGIYLPDCNNSYYKNTGNKTNLLENEYMKNEKMLVCKLKDDNAGKIYI